MFPGAECHRPLEALKLVLFELQAVQGSLSQTKRTEQKEEVEKVSNGFPYVCCELEKHHRSSLSIGFQGSEEQPCQPVHPVCPSSMCSGALSPPCPVAAGANCRLWAAWQVGTVAVAAESRG